jgi:hypothetical protein
MAAFGDPFLKLHIFCAALAFLTLSRAAEARPTPEPKPSGIVIHLFGPTDSTTTGGTGTKPANAASNQNVGAILHQMFVTGDPNQKPGAAFAKGRASQPR